MFSGLVKILLFLLLFFSNEVMFSTTGGKEVISDKQVEVNESEKPAMVEARIEGETEGYSIKNTYDYNYYTRNVVGMVGVPIEVESRESDYVKEEFSLIFVYDEEELECDEEALGILWYNEKTGFFDTVSDYQADYGKNEIRVPVKNLGSYILEDMKIWQAAWNGTYIQNWRQVFEAEDIVTLADTSIYDDSGEYHITTVEQLAGLVELVNEGNSFTGCDFYLDADLDLTGYEWAPIGWCYPTKNGVAGQDFPFNGRFWGNGHAIYNMHIEAPQQSCVGMFGRTLQGFEVHDLALIDCYVEGEFYVGGILGDNINSGDKFDMTNCVVSGTVIGKLNSGALVGSSAYLNIKDCYAVMEEGTTVLTGDLRSGYIENCFINDETAKEAISQFLGGEE